MQFQRHSVSCVRHKQVHHLFLGRLKMASNALIIKFIRLNTTIIVHSAENATLIIHSALGNLYRGNIIFFYQTKKKSFGVTINFQSRIHFYLFIFAISRNVRFKCKEFSIMFLFYLCY